ncbi:MAG: YbaK/EbsC family protein, partial [bacterium]|nr:YbaK/EbsC family protein [bacterium]
MSQTSFKNLHKLLIDRGVAFKVITHKPVFTIDDVVRELNIPHQATTKTLLIYIAGKGMFRVVLQGRARLDIGRLASILKVS